jgi:sugar lactone lactonase YvrE
MRAEQITGSVAYHAEGPVWSDSWGGLRWVDMLAGDVLSLAADATVRRRHVATVVAALRPRAGGGAVIGTERGFALEDAGGAIEPLVDVWTDPAVRMNEGGCDPQGRFYCGSMAYDQRPGAAALYRLDPDGSVSVVLHAVTISNGLDFSPDGSTAYYVDTPTGRIDRFDYDIAGNLSGRRAFVELPPGAGHPDGLTVDAEGGVWIALNGGGAVRRYTADGTLDGIVEVGARQVTACTFGGEGLRELFITTSRENLSPDEDPAAGSLFRVIPGVDGRPVRDFAG